MRRIMQDDEMVEIKKGPWKPEEDQVLINHVKRYGPRDWSSIRSKGLLCRTGKSCRLRWVNKLRPDLKTGVKFSVEEERMVIDLQSQFGNKWARIATYLPGRTDNDVKNFWSSRKKRLARILHASEASPSSAKLHKINHVQEPVPVSGVCEIPSLEVMPKYSSSPEEESLPMPKPLQSWPGFGTDHHDGVKMVPSPEMVYPGMLGYDHCPIQLDYLSVEREQEQFPEPPNICFPQIPQLQPDFPLLTDSQDFITRFGEPSFLDEFEQMNGTREMAMAPSTFVPETNCLISGREEIEDAMDLNSFINDFSPIDIFDDIERLPNPSEWS